METCYCALNMTVRSQHDGGYSQILAVVNHALADTTAAFMWNLCSSYSYHVHVCKDCFISAQQVLHLECTLWCNFPQHCLAGPPGRHHHKDRNLERMFTLYSSVRRVTSPEPMYIQSSCMNVEFVFTRDDGCPDVELHCKAVEAAQ